MSRRRGCGSSDTIWRLYDIGGADLALRYLEIAEESHEQAAHEEREREPGAARAPQRFIAINGVCIGDDQVSVMERAWGTPVPDGRYWYDPVCGAWGREGGPCSGFVQAGLQLGGALRRDASHGDTGILINGRELHFLDLLALQPSVPLFPGRYWLDPRGDFGWEGGPRLGTIAAARIASAAARDPSTLKGRLESLGASGSGFEVWRQLPWRNFKG